MTFEFLIARRYLFSKKSHNAINIISAISVVGIGVATMALVIVMSVFNGFQGLVADLFSGFDAELRITPIQGSHIDLQDTTFSILQQSSDVAIASPIYEAQALAIVGNQQKVITLKGVDDNFLLQSNIKDFLHGDADPILHIDVIEYCIPGIGICDQLSLPLNFPDPIQIYVPKHGERVNIATPQSSFIQEELYASGLCFNVNQSKYDSEYILCSLNFAQRIYGHPNKSTAIEIKLAHEGKQENIKKMVGKNFNVHNRYEQQEDIFRVMQIEKLISYAFLCFILFVACLNIMGSLSMLIIEKKDNIRTISALGASTLQIRKIFIFEGLQIILGGAFIGLLIGLCLCLIQEHFGLIRMGQSEGSFIVDAYPVIVNYTDLLYIILTVIALGFFSVLWATRNLKTQ